MGNMTAPLSSAIRSCRCHSCEFGEDAWYGGSVAKLLRAASELLDDRPAASDSDAWMASYSAMRFAHFNNSLMISSVESWVRR